MLCILLRPAPPPPEPVPERNPPLALPYVVPAEGHRPVDEFHLQPIEEVRLHIVLRREIVSRTTVRRVDDQVADELRLSPTAGGPAFWIEVAGVQEIVDADHRGAEHMAGVLQDDTETIQLDLFPVRKRLSGSAATDFQDRDGLRRHDPARREVVHMSVAHDAARRLPRGIEDDLLQAFLDEDSAFVTHAHHDRLVKMYRVGTRRFRPVQYLQRSQR